ncbi:MAG: NADH:flavin oxidoreductase/NADH oxidase [Candidatus Latescibacterota bacterium]
MDTVLFSPLQLRGVTLRNRIVLSPMLQYVAQGGYVTDWHFVHLGKFATGGVGLVFMESTKVESRGCSTPSDVGLWKDDYIDSLRRITELIKSYGAAPGIQLSHAGRKGRRSVPWEGRIPLASCPGVDHGEEWDLIGPSAIAHAEKYSVPREMTRDDIHEVVEAWGQGARRANEAGFDVLEIHGAHGYLIHQFLSPVANMRTDEYGGSFENRARFAIEVVRRVRHYWPESKPLFFRMSVVDEVGRTIEDSIALATMLKDSGVDVVDCSSGGMSTRPASENSSQYGYQVEYARRIKADADIMTMAVGMIIHGDQAENILKSQSADLVALGRELLHNPNWPIDAAQKLGIESPFAHISPVYGFWLEKRAQSNFTGKPSTWQSGINASSKPN